MPEMKGFDEISAEDKERLTLTGINTEKMNASLHAFIYGEQAE